MRKRDDSNDNEKGNALFSAQCDGGQRSRDVSKCDERDISMPFMNKESFPIFVYVLRTLYVKGMNWNE